MKLRLRGAPLFACWLLLWPASCAFAAVDVARIERVMDASAFMEVAFTHGGAEPAAASFEPLLARKADLARYPNQAWFRIEVVNSLARPIAALLEIPQPRIGRLHVRLLDGTAELATYRLGSSVPLKERPIAHVNPTIPLRMAPGEKMTVLLHATSADNLTFSPRLWTAAGFGEHILVRSLLVGLALGALCAFGAYNAIVYAISRDAKFLLLAAVFASLAFWQSTALGYAPLLLWPNLPALTPSMTVGSIPLCVTILLVYVVGLLDLSGRLTRALWVLVLALSVATLALAVWPNPHTFQALVWLFAPAHVFVLAVMLREAWRGDARARQLTLAMAPLFATFLLGAANRSLDLAIDSELVQNALLVASVFCGVVLAVSPATRIRALSQERSLAEMDARLAEVRARESDEKAAVAERENRAKTSFLATMSHEIRTPMNGVLGMAELLQQTRLDEQQHYYIATLKRSGQALMSILNDVLDYSKVEAGHVEIELMDVDLLEMLDDLNLLYREHIKRKSLDFHTYLQPDVPLRFRTDPTRLKQIVSNLLNNAIKFTDHGEVELSISRVDATHLEISIRDTGIGIGSEHQAGLFDRFKQADSSISRRYGGTGLGLAISKHLVHLLGGTIRLESAPHRGSTFTFTVAIDALPEPAPSVEPRRVILVSDDEALGRSMALIVPRWGWTFEQVDDAAAAAPKSGDYVIVDDDCVESIPEDGWPVGTTSLRLGDAEDPDVALSRPLLLGRFTALMRGGERSRPAPSGEQPLLGVDVLVAEDNLTNRLVVGKLLTSWGATVHFAEDGVEALDLVKSDRMRIDLVLMDCEMPNQDGYTATAEIRSHEAQSGATPVPIIALTAHALPEFRARATEAGMTGYVTKPLKKHELLQTMLSSLGARREAAVKRPPHRRARGRLH